MKEAIVDYKIKGIATTLPFGYFVMDHEAFSSGKFDTHFVKNYYQPNALIAQQEAEAKMAAKVALYQYLEDLKLVRLPN